MKKDIEWLKREIHKELESWHGVEGGIDGDGINEIMLLINQLDETEILSQEWINKHSNGPSRSQYVWVNDLKELLVPKQEITVEQVAEYLRERNITAVDSALMYRENLDNKIVIEKPKIPQFIADWIEKSRNKGYNIHGVFQKAPKNVEKWLYFQNSSEKIVRLGLAYLLDEYEVEKELIHDYEYKAGTFDWATAFQNAIHGEESEMKKGVEWLKEEITEILLTSKKDGTNYFYYKDLKEKIYNVIDQLDEPKQPKITLQDIRLKLWELPSGSRKYWLEQLNDEFQKGYFVPLGLKTTDGEEQYLSYNGSYFASRRDKHLQQTFDTLEEIPEFYRDLAERGI